MMDDNQKIQDANPNPLDTGGITEQNQVDNEIGEINSNEAWANWHPVTVKTDGLREHTGTKLTDKQLSESNAPRRGKVTVEDYRRKVGRATVQIGQMDAQPKGLDYTGLNRADYDQAVSQGLDMTDQRDIDYVKTIKRARTDG